MSEQHTNLTWMITGANRGLGRAVAEAAAARGDTVIATARNREAVEDFDHALALDVTDPTSVEDAVDEAVGAASRIDVLVNNAGHGLIGALEELSDADLQRVIDVNVLGVLRVTRAVLPHMRARRSGHIVQMSSVGGVVANPGHTAYGTSKFALEGMSEALAGEVAPFGIRVSLVEPGPFRTDFAGDSMQWSEAIAAYAETPAGGLRTRFPAQHGNQPNDPARAAALVLAAVDDPDSPLRLPMGPEALDRIEQKLTGQLEDLARWRPRGEDTRFAE